MLTTRADLENQARKFWAPGIVPKLNEKAIIAGLISREYEGEIKKSGDTVYVSAVNETEADVKTEGTGDDTNSFSSRKMGTTRIAVTANKVITASFEMADLIDLQTQLGDPSGKSAIMDVLMRALVRKLNRVVYEVVAPSTSGPDHDVSGVSDCNAAAVGNLKMLASRAHWPEGNRFLLLDPSYHNDFLQDTKLTSADYVNDNPLIEGKAAHKRFGFYILEDDSEAMSECSPTAATSDLGIAFTPDFAYLVMQRAPEIRIGDQLANNKLGYVIVISMVVGVALGIEGANKHIVQYNT